MKDYIQYQPYDCIVEDGEIIDYKNAEEAFDNLQKAKDFCVNTGLTAICVSKQVYDIDTRQFHEHNAQTICQLTDDTWEEPDYDYILGD